MHFLKRRPISADMDTASLHNGQLEELHSPSSKKSGRKKLCLLGLCLVVLAAAATGCRLSSGDSPRSGEYAGRLSLPDGGDIPCSVALEADGNALKGTEIRLPFGGEIIPDAPLSLRKQALGDTKQITAGGLALTLTLEDRPPQSEITDYETARRAEHLCLAGNGDAFYHTCAFSCGRQAPGEPARYFSSQAEAKLYGLSRCPHCLTAEGQPLEPAPAQQPEAAESASSQSSSSRAAAGSRPAASQPSAGKSEDNPVASAPGETCKELLCQTPSLPGCDYCASHKCGVSDCGELRTDSHYCQKHSCPVSDCPYPNYGAVSSPCEEHTCHYPECSQEAVKPGGYCQGHFHRHASGCGAGRRQGNYGLCERYPCTVPGCTQGVFNGTAYCEDHQVRE